MSVTGSLCFASAMPRLQKDKKTCDQITRFRHLSVEMRAIQLSTEGTKTELVVTERPQPQPGDDELLIRVYAAGVTPTELHWYPTTHKQDGSPRAHAIPGHEFSGVVAGLGSHASGFTVGQEVFGLNHWFADGATAEFCVTKPEQVASKPRSLTHEEAATVPIGALTAWQGLFDRAKIRPGERVLVQGGSGSVGLFAVQLAHAHGAHVIATASTPNLALLTSLGANEALDYRADHFDDQTEKVDVVFDTVGGKTLDRSWSVLRPGGRLVTVASDSEFTASQRDKAAFFIVEPSQPQLEEIAKRLNAGTLKTFVKGIVRLEDAAVAYTGTVPSQRGYGKLVVTVHHGG